MRAPAYAGKGLQTDWTTNERQQRGRSFVFRFPLNEVARDNGFSFDFLVLPSGDLQRGTKT